MIPYPLQEAPAAFDASREVVLRAGKFLLGFLAVYLAGRLFVVPAASRVVRRRNRNNPTIQEATARYLRLAMIVIALMAAIAVAGYGQVLTRSAIIVAAATIAVGVAGQEVIGALISGIFLIVDPDFSVGDWIVWNSGEGVVEAISFRVTRVRTPNDETVIVPNTELTTSSITRPYGRAQHRVDETVGVGYDDDAGAAMAALREAAASNRSVLSDPAPRVYFLAFGDDAVELQVQYWIRNPTRRDVLRVRSEVAREIQSRLEGAGVTISPASQRELAGGIRVERTDA